MEINSIIICTVERSPEYLHSTLGRLLFTLKDKKDIHLVVDGYSKKYYAMYKDYSRVYLHRVDKRCDNKLKRAAVNYARCLNLSQQLGGLNLILEDDVLLNINWEDKLNSINIEKDSWIFSLNNIQNKNSIKDYEEFFTLENECPQRVWCQTYAVVYGAKTLEGLSEEMLKICFHKNVAYDISLGAIFCKNKTSIYECVPSFVEHIGIRSSTSKDVVAP